MQAEKWIDFVYQYHSHKSHFNRRQFSISSRANTLLTNPTRIKTPASIPVEIALPAVRPITK